MSHPALPMSKPREKAWREAEDKDFFEQLRDLAVIYARRKRGKRGKLDETKLFVDYKKWLESDKIKELSVADGA